MYFRGKRIAIPLAAIAVISFFALGGHGKIAEAVIGRVVGYLMGGVEIDASNSDLLSVAEAHEIRSVSIEHALGTDGVVIQTSQPASTEDALTVSGDEMIVAQASESAIQDTANVQQGGKAQVNATRAYTASYLRDPFYSLMASEEARPTKLLDISRAKMVGSVWGETGIIALLEDDRGRSYALRVGDKVVNGKVTAVTPGSVTFSITVFGMTKQVTLEIAEEGEW